MYAWRVPGDFKINGNEETLTIKATYETHELYGTVVGKREITVSP
jgi:hypothetical protein